MVTFKIDGRSVSVESGISLLDALQKQGVHVPTLCHHPSLAPSGACRLCTVEIRRPSWDGRSRLVTSCLYPVENELEVFTHSERVIKARKTLLELYLARCPDSAILLRMARAEGVDTSAYEARKEADDCTMCGLCTRVCQELGPAAISTLDRGIGKSVGPGPADSEATDCTACLCCAHVCPTDAIKVERSGGKLTIWNKSFEIPTASVDSQLCRACGRCEEVCPSSVPRVTAFANGNFVSHISDSACVGCGICVGSCPTGAISQAENLYETVAAENLEDRAVTFACSRSRVPGRRADFIEVPCVASVPVDLLLGCLAAGARGVQLLCRDRDTCPYGRGGEIAADRALLAEELACSTGLAPGCVVYTGHVTGLSGPSLAIEEFQNSLQPTPLKNHRKLPPGPSGMDGSLAALAWLREQHELDSDIPRSLRALFDRLPPNPDRLFYLGDTAELDLLLSTEIDGWRLKELISDAVELLASKGGATPVTSKTGVETSTAGTVVVFAPGCHPGFDRKLKIVSLDELAGKEPAVASPTRFSARLSRHDRKELADRLRQSDGPLRCSTHYELAQLRLLQRDGAWLQAPERRLFMAFSEKTAQVGQPEKQNSRRIESHPILPSLPEADVEFFFNGKAMKARRGEVISSALYANGVSIFGHHKRDNGAQGIFCVNGQCSQCTVIADGRPVKSCMVPVQAGMRVESCEGLPSIAEAEAAETRPEVETKNVQVLVIGGGPAGICAAIELGRLGVDVLVVDDKQELGGKLSLQTHNFFGSVADCFAGTRGVDIGHKLESRLRSLESVDIWLESTVIGVFSDGVFGVSTRGSYRLVRPDAVLVAAGAREKSLVFPGCDLPGVYGAGAFQTLVNRDLVRCAEKLFIIGGGNVGLIGAYHALQAGIDVVGLVEALARCGGYKVHEDKIRRLGVPVWTSHTVLRVEGREKAEAVVIAGVDNKFRVIPGTEKRFEIDTVLIAVGLSPVDELYQKAAQYGLKVYSAGDAQEIAEASAAIFSGKITGRTIARDLGIDIPVPSDWSDFGEILKHRPGECAEFLPPPAADKAPVRPLIRCVQEIPCNPCTESCPHNFIKMPGSILALPEFEGDCLGCGRCVLACPGLAINLLCNDYDPSGEKALLMMPFEFSDELVPFGRELVTTDMEGEVVGTGKLVAMRKSKSQDRRKLVLVEVPNSDKHRAAGFRIREPGDCTATGRIAGGKNQNASEETEDPIVCRCERVRKSEIVEQIRAGVRDMNQLKATIRTGTGACGGKTCKELILRIFREEGVPMDEITQPTIRPLVAEVHLGDFVKWND